MNIAFIDWVRNLVSRHSFVRFVVAGGVNTGVTYGIYLALLNAVGYKVSYTIAYVCGIIISYLLNWLFVFQSHRGWRSVVTFPFVYVFQYLFNLVILWCWVDLLHLNARVGLLVALVITVPVTYLLLRRVYVKGAKYG